MERIPIYFVPGLATSPTIFDSLSLDSKKYTFHYIHWIHPIDIHETLADYALRLSAVIKHENPVLIGVSFGGILVQEMAKHINTKKVIIISSVKSNLEFPRRMKIAKSTKAYKLIPMSLILNLENLAKFSFGAKINHRLKLYRKFLSVRDIGYLEWAVEKVILWERTVVDESVIHIHGDMDDVFPIKYIKDCTVVKGGSHIMILNKYRWFNANLAAIIVDTKTSVE